MNVLDLTHKLNHSMPVYPGTERPLFLEGNTIEKDGFEEKKITMFSHTGTHMDAPAHLLTGASRLDDFSVDKFMGRASVLDATTLTSGEISLEFLRRMEHRLIESDYLLIHTGHDRHWGEKRYFSKFPVLTEEAARWLVQFPLKGIGVDVISVDPVHTSDFPVHKILLGKELVIIENLTGLEKLPDSEFLFSALPLNIEEADGSPVRAVAILD